MLLLSSTYQISRINYTAIELVLGIITISGYIIRKTQFLFVVGAVYFIFTSHFLILVFRDYGGVFAEWNVTPFLVTVSILLITFAASFHSNPSRHGVGAKYSQILSFTSLRGLDPQLFILNIPWKSRWNWHMAYIFTRLSARVTSMLLVYLAPFRSGTRKCKPWHSSTRACTLTPTKRICGWKIKTTSL